jgi:hypothetical protein
MKYRLKKRMRFQGYQVAVELAPDDGAAALAASFPEPLAGADGASADGLRPLSRKSVTYHPVPLS